MAEKGRVALGPDFTRDHLFCPHFRDFTHTRGFPRKNTTKKYFIPERISPHSDFLNVLAMADDAGAYLRRRFRLQGVRTWVA
jgi:hypothetical protein